MDLTPNNFATLSKYLQDTLSPDPQVRRPGKFFPRKFFVSKEIHLYLVKIHINHSFL